MISQIGSNYVYPVSGVNCLVFLGDPIVFTGYPGPPLQMFFGILLQIIYRLHEEVLIILKMPVMTSRPAE